MAYTSTQTGDWDDAATWGGGGFPGVSDTATIADTHVVSIKGIERCGNVTVNVGGTLRFDGQTNSVDAHLSLDGNSDITNNGTIDETGTGNTAFAIIDGNSITSHLLSDITWGNGWWNLQDITVDPNIVTGGGGCYILASVDYVFFQNNLTVSVGDTLELDAGVEVEVGGTCYIDTIIFHSSTASKFDYWGGSLTINNITAGVGSVWLNPNCNIPAVDFYDLVLTDWTYTPDSGTIRIGGTLTVGYNYGAGSVDCSVNNPNFTISGDIDISQWSSWIHGTGTMTFDNNSVYNVMYGTAWFDYGNVSVTGTLTLVDSLKVKNLTISGTLDAGGYGIRIDGDWESSSGTFTHSTGTVQWTSGTATLTPGTQEFYDLTIDAGADVTWNGKIGVLGTQTGSVTNDQSGTTEMSINNDLTINGTFHINGGGGGTSTGLGGVPFWV